MARRRVLRLQTGHHLLCIHVVRLRCTPLIVLHLDFTVRGDVPESRNQRPSGQTDATRSNHSATRRPDVTSASGRGARFRAFFGTKIPLPALGRRRTPHCVGKRVGENRNAQPVCGSRSNRVARRATDRSRIARAGLIICWLTATSSSTLHNQNTHACGLGLIQRAGMAAAPPSGVSRTKGVFCAQHHLAAVGVIR